MYRVCVQKNNEEAEWKIVESIEDLRAIITFAPSVEYDILLVEKVNVEYGKEFLERIIKEYNEKEGLVTGEKEDK